MSIYGITAFVGGPMNAYVTAARGSWSVPRALTLISASFNTGAILGPLMGGWVGQQLGLRSSFGFSLIFMVISTILIIFIRPQPVEGEQHESPANTLAKMLNPAFVRFLIMAFGIYFFIYLPQPLAQNFLVNERQLNLANIGVLISSRSLGVVVLSLLTGSLDARRGLAATQIGVTLFTLIIWQGYGLPAFMLGYALMGSTNPSRVMLMAQARSLSKAQNMGLAYGMLETILSVVLITAPPLAGALYAFQPDLVFPISAAGILITLVLSWVLRPQTKASPNTEETQTPI
ncbi:MAG: MFS transporter [Holophaga sp.]|nr:MFS transporter [Holophaga sp.]